MCGVRRQVLPSQPAAFPHRRVTPAHLGAHLRTQRVSLTEVGPASQSSSSGSRLGHGRGLSLALP
jgi:hypothetical protein